MHMSDKKRRSVWYVGFIVWFKLYQYKYVFVWLFYFVKTFNLRLTVPLVEISLKYTIGAFTILKKLTFPKGMGIFISLWWISLDQYLFHTIRSLLFCNPITKHWWVCELHIEYMTTNKTNTELTQCVDILNSYSFSNIILSFVFVLERPAASRPEGKQIHHIDISKHKLKITIRSLNTICFVQIPSVSPGLIKIFISRRYI